MGATTAAVIMGVVGFGLSAAGGAMQGSAKRKQYDAQANLIEQDTRREVERIRTEGKEFREHQTLAYLKAGVEIEGTPFMVLKETAKRQAEAVWDTHESGMQRAESMRQTGQAAQRQAMFSGLSQGFGGMFNMIGNSAIANAG